jgi:hypothetical protein
MRTRRLVPLAIATLAIAPYIARAQKPAPANYVAPSPASIHASLEQGNGILPSRAILVRNLSSVAIEVDTVTLHDCSNVRELCGAHGVHVRIPAGATVTVMTINPHDNTEPFEFQFGYSWRAAPALRLLGRNEIAQLGPRITHLRVEPDSLVMLLGERVTMDHVRILAYGAREGTSDGDLLGQIVSYRQRIRPDVVTLSGDTLIARNLGRTALTLGLVEPAQPLSVTLPIVVVPADTTR